LVIRVRNFSSGIGPYFPLAGGLLKFYPKTSKTATTTLCVIKVASQSTFIHEKLHSTCEVEEESQKILFRYLLPF
jgi:hypothetical protein